jgi:hypothetical protein
MEIDSVFSCSGGDWRCLHAELRLRFAFWGYTPHVFAKSGKVVWNDWDAKMGKIKSLEGAEFEGLAAARKVEKERDQGGDASHVAG